MGMLLFSEMKDGQKAECFRDYVGSILSDHILAGLIDHVLTREQKVDLANELRKSDPEFRKFIYPRPSFVPSWIKVKTVPQRCTGLYNSTMRLSYDGMVDFMPNYGHNGYIAIRKQTGKRLIRNDDFNGFVLVDENDLTNIVGFLTEDDLIYEVIK